MKRERHWVNIYKIRFDRIVICMYLCSCTKRVNEYTIYYYFYVTYYSYIGNIYSTLKVSMGFV